jgi:hypothetical protein
MGDETRTAVLYMLNDGWVLPWSAQFVRADGSKSSHRFQSYLEGMAFAGRHAAEIVEVAS